MDGNYLVNVEISSRVKHHMLESHARPVRGNLRHTTRKLFEHGQKPYKHYLKKFQDTPTDVKIAGNFSNFGCGIEAFAWPNSFFSALLNSANQNRTKDVECNDEIRLETGIAGCPLTGFEHANS
jgi:hypothetical protein